MAARVMAAAPQADIAPALALDSTQSIRVSGVALDSRQLAQGNAFVALQGASTHGLDHIESALAAGVSTVLVDADDPRRSEIDGCAATIHAVPGLRAKLPALARAVSGSVDQELALCGVTGTDGKTSTAFFLAQLLHTSDNPCGVMGTVGNGFVGRLETASHTTGDVLAVYSGLRALLDQGATRVAMEVSSHALDQARVGGLQFAVGALTGLGRDHLDYHGSLEHYRAAKRRLFTEHARRWVLNLDDDMGAELFAERSDAVGYSITGQSAARWCAEIERCDADGIQCRITVGEDAARSLKLGVLGRFNVSNVLAACAMAECVGLSVGTVLDRLTRITPVVGRLDVLRFDGAARVVIDYAHTEQALESAIAALREHVSGRLWCVFGCGGDRDRGKRAGMARAACDADRVVLTSDNPRSESPEAIARDAQQGLVAGVPADILLDRTAAIEFALEHAGPTDCILIAGKGHETYQEINAQRIAFSDHAVVRAWHGRRA